MNEINPASKPTSSSSSSSPPSQPINDTSNDSSAKSAFSSFCFNKLNLNTDTKFSVSELVYKCRHSRKLVLLVVFIALFFDNMLLTTVGKYSLFLDEFLGPI